MVNYYLPLETAFPLLAIGYMVSLILLFAVDIVDLVAIEMIKSAAE